MGKSAKSKQNSSGYSEPWSYTIPAVRGIVDKAASAGGIGMTPDQASAFGVLKNNAAQGNPWAQQSAQLANDAYGTVDRTGGVSGAYNTLQNRLGSYADGSQLDPMSNPQMQAMLTQVGDDVQNRINSMFAGAGRDLSGANQQAVARGVTQAQLPLLLDQYNRAQDQQIGASQALYGAGVNTATTNAGLDAQRQGLRAQGAGFGQQAIDQRNYAANSMLDLEQQIKGMPYEDLALLSSILLPIAGLGGSSESKGTAKTSTSLFSDERVKEDVREVGALADGQKVYAYHYKGDPSKTTHMGLLAQEVERAAPTAVSEHGGVKAVEYDHATRKAAEILAKRKGGRA